MDEERSIRKQRRRDAGGGSVPSFGNQIATIFLTLTFAVGIRTGNVVLFVFTRQPAKPHNRPVIQVSRVVLRNVEYFPASHPTSQTCKVFIRTPRKSCTTGRLSGLAGCRVKTSTAKVRANNIVAVWSPNDGIT